MAKKTRRPRRPRDPFWRLRRLLVGKRKESAKRYRRAQRRRIERAARQEPE